MQFSRLFGFITAMTLVAVTIVSPYPAQSAQYNLDPSHTSVVFSVDYFDLAPVYGMFLDVDGNATYNPENISETSISFTVETSSVFTNVKRRDNHLKSGDFLNSSEYPTMTFKSTSVESSGENELSVTGKFSLHGTTREITVPVTLTGSGPGPQGNHRQGFKTKFTIDRTNYGIDHMPDNLAHEVSITVAGQLIRQ